MNRPEQFEVVFNGQIAGKKRLDEVKQQMGAMFHLDPVKLEALFTGRPVVVKKNLSKDMAEKYRLAIGKAGGISVVAEMDSVQSEVSEPEDAKQQDRYHSYLITANKFTCPACGHEQLVAEKCNNCFISFEEYKEEERLRKKKENMERWLADKNAKAKAGPAAAAADVTRRETMKETQPEPESKKRSLLAPLTGLCILALGALAASVYLGLIQL